jgi:hypothetical protein
MNFITVIKNLLPKKIQRPVGRWRLENCKSSMNQKIDLSNEDHCGPCGQYALEKRDVFKDKITLSTSVTNHKKI